MNANHFGRTRRRSVSLARAPLVFAALLLAAAIAGCGRRESEGGESSDQAAGRTDGGMPICQFLSKEQVSAVLPNNDGGMDVSLGSGLTKNARSYQCSYTAVHDTDADLMTVIVTVGADSSAFTFIKPSRSSKQDFPIFRDVDIAEGGMLYGKPGDIQVEAWKGTTLISVELTAPGAERHADQLVDFAKLVASKVD
jgi:hypothetical protein